MKKSSLFFYSLFIVGLLIGHQSASAAILCSKVHSSSQVVQKPISDLSSFNEAMTRGMLLSPEQADLFEIYRKTSFGDPNTSVGGKTLKDVDTLVAQNPGLEKPHFREINLQSVSKVYEIPEALSKYVKSMTSSAGQVRSNLFQIEANLGFWKKVLGYEDPALPNGLSKDQQKEAQQKLKQRFLRYMDYAVSEKNRQFLADPKADYREKVITLYKVLDHIQKWMEKRGKNTQVIRQAMVDLVATSGFGNAATVELLKSKNGLERIEGLTKILDERDSVAMDLGFKDHFQQMLTDLKIDFPTGSNKSENVTQIIATLERDVLAGNFTLVPSDVMRVRSLSIQEAPFRSCLGGSDCSSRTYFSKALDPNYNYFTITNRYNQSSGHITVVLGTAGNTKSEKAHKVAFIDKIQNVPNQLLPKMLEAVRQTLALKGYLLVIPENLGGHNGISNLDTTIQFLSKEILPGLKARLTKFTPHPNEYNFPNQYSRAYEGLDVRIVSKQQFDADTKFVAGSEYRSWQAPKELTKKQLVKELIALRDSEKPEDLNKYIDSGSVIIGLEKIGLMPNGSYRADLGKIIGNKENDFKLRRKAFLQVCLGEKSLPKSIIGLFDSAERTQILSEMKQWSNSSDQNKQKFLANVEKTMIEGGKDIDVAALIQLGFEPVKFFSFAIKDWKFDAALGLAQNYKMNINAKDGSQQTPLMTVINYGRDYNGGDRFLTFLLNHPDLDVNAKDQSGKTALTYAVEKEKLDLVKILLTRMNMSDDEKSKTLNNLYVLSSGKGCAGICSYLKEQMTTFDSSVALNSFRAATKEWKFDIALDLARLHGLDINEKDSSGQTPLMIAINYGRDYNGGESFLTYLLQQKGLDVDAKDRSGKTALTYAVEKEKLELVKVLLLRMAMSPEERAQTLNNLYVLSSGKGCTSICSFLKSQMSQFDRSTAEKSFTVSVKEWKFDTALELAKDYKLDINAKDSSMQTPLMVAISYGRDYNGGERFMQFLLKHPNLDVDTKDRSGKTALAYAVEKENLELVKILLPRMKLSADEKKQILDNLYIVSSGKGCKGVCTFLKSQMKKLDPAVAQTAFMAATKEWKFDLALELVKENKIDINSTDSSQQTPLMIAITYGRDYNGGDRFIEFLLSQPSLNVSLADRAGKTALTYAIEKGKAEVANKLRQRGAR